MFALVDIAWFIAGGAAVWFYKDKILTQLDKLKGKAKAVEDAAKK
jgi:hypothetical protein